MKQPRKKMRGTIFRWICIPFMVLALVFGICLATITNYFSPSLDTFLGKGKLEYSTPQHAQGWNAQFYNFKAKNAEEALHNSAQVAEQIGDEGEVLLKNDGLLPLSKDTQVSPLGYAYLNPVMSGSGSGGTDTSCEYAYSAERGIKEAFSHVNTTMVNAMKKAKPAEIKPQGADGDGGATAFMGAATIIREFDVEDLKAQQDSLKNTVGIVFIGRGAGEGGDLNTKPYEDGTPHQLALSENEKKLLSFAQENCKGVVVVVNSTNAMQLADLQDNPGVNAVLQIATPGALGFKSLGKILNGTVNPSGRTVDTFVADNTKVPTFANFDDNSGNFMYQNTEYTRNYWLAKFTGGSQFKAPFREYEEGVYVGYRYYETASSLGYFTSANLPEGVSDPYYNRDNGVVYPFGYGLSYSSFEQKIEDISVKNGTVTASVSVKNTGKTAGKEVVQLYYGAPYTPFDVENKIEKSTVNLLAFGKTQILQPGESETVKLSFEQEDMASYSYTHKNPSGTTGSYVLEQGDYTISLRSDSHTVIDSHTMTIADTVWYDSADTMRKSDKQAQAVLDEKGNATDTPMKSALGEKVDFTPASNQFDNANAYMTNPDIGHDVSILSRADWANTQPSAPTDQSRTASDSVKKWLDYNFNTIDLGNGQWDQAHDPLIGDGDNSKIYVAESDAPASKQHNGLVMSHMRGLSYDDPQWDKLLDQLDYNDPQLQKALFVAAFATGELDSVGKPATTDHDGPQGLALNDTSGKSWVTACSFPSETTMAQTFNTELAYAMGAAVGEENHYINGAGWYAPAANLHWSAFSGRNYEYYSEDPIISGFMAAGVISGAGDKGTYTSFKHFAMVDQENNRGKIPAIWATEQTIREIYLKPFEIGLKKAKKTISYISDDKGTVSTKVMRAGDYLMTSGWAGIGGLWTAWDYNLMTNVLRNEWGFKGTVVTDYDMGNGPRDNAAVNRLVRAGTTQHMLDMTLSPGTYTATQTATGKMALRRAVKDTLYTMANSAQTNNMVPGATAYYQVSPWRLGVWAIDAVLAVLIILGVIVIILRARDEKLHPENYKQKRVKDK